MGEGLLRQNHDSFVIDDSEIDRLVQSFPVTWKSKDSAPDKCYLGCPQLSGEQIDWWAENIRDALRQRRRKKIKVPTTISAAPQTLLKVEQSASWQILVDAGVKFSAGCPMQLFDNSLPKK